MYKKYDSFSSYLEDTLYNPIFSKLKTYIINNKQRMNIATSLVPYPSYVELSDFHIMGVSFHDSDTDKIGFNVAIQAEIEVKGKSKYDYESDSAEQWFKIPLNATLKDGLQNIQMGYISEYSKEKFNAEDALTKYLVPYMYVKDLDLHAEKFLEKYCPEALKAPMPLPIKEITETMGLTVYYAPLPDNMFGRTYFNKANVKIYGKTEDVVSTDVDEGTILVNPRNSFMYGIGSENNTIIHECVHWDKHYKFFELQKILNPELNSISCAVVDGYKKEAEKLENELSWMEWQANALAPRILIPEKTGRTKLNEILGNLARSFTSTRQAEIMQYAISEFANFFNVSTTAAKIRAIELGFEQAAGVFNYVDGKYYPPFSFAKGSINKNQTFIVDRNNIIFESNLNTALIEDIKEHRFIHAGGMLVINDPKYVDISEDSEATLTDYALEHVDECCLVFNRTTRVSKQYDDSFYRICFLCRDADSKNFVEAKFNPKEGNNEDVQKRAREMATIKKEANRISGILSELPSSFSGTLDCHIKRRKYTNEKMEDRSYISSRTIQDYRNNKNKKPALQSVLALCIGLNLQPAFSYDLISKAGYNIMIPSDENLIYRYLIDHHHMENIDMWNEKLKDAGINQQLPSNRNKNF